MKRIQRFWGVCLVLVAASWLAVGCARTREEVSKVAPTRSDTGITTAGLKTVTLLVIGMH